MILWVVDLIILAIPIITSKFGWVELDSFVTYLMDCTWVENYRYMNLGYTWYSIHDIQ